MIRPSIQPESPLRQNSSEGGYQPVQAYTDIRTVVFGTDLGDLAQRRADTADRIWGVVMEAGYPDAVVTLLALTDGTVNLYLSSGGGMTGLGDCEPIGDAAQRLIMLSDHYRDDCDAASEFPLPERGGTRFYLMTYTGMLCIGAAEQDLRCNPRLAPLFARGHELLMIIRSFTEQAAERSGEAVPAPRPN